MVGAFLWLTPNDLVNFTKSAIGALFSISNFVFLIESGYWDTSAEFKPLLHTWSLGVEEQFYLFWPIFLILVSRFGTRLRWLTIAGVTLISLFAAEWLTQKYPSASFFMTPFRIFEFGIGALTIPVLRNEAVRQALSKSFVSNGFFATGLFAIIGSVLFFKGTTPFPGFYALVPCLGAVLILVSGGSVLSRICLENPLAIWAGRVSYSMYLVHWPIIVFYRYKTGHEIELAEKLILGSAILVSTVLLYYLVEKRLRIQYIVANSLPYISPAKFASVVGVFAAFLAVANTYGWATSGLKWRPIGEIAQYAEKTGAEFMSYRREQKSELCQNRVEAFCGKLSSDKENVVLIGNSWAPGAFASFKLAFPDTNFLMGEMGACPPFFAAYFEDIEKEIKDICYDYNRERERSLRALAGNGLDTVIMSSRIPPGTEMAVARTLRDIAALGYRVLYLGEIPDYSTSVSSWIISQADISTAEKNLNALRDFSGKPVSDESMLELIDLTTLEYIRRLDFFCPDNVCRLLTEDRSALVIFDHHHLTEEAALEFASYLRDEYPLVFEPASKPEWNPNRNPSALSPGAEFSIPPT